jgi:hypothetical protein
MISIHDPIRNTKTRDGQDKTLNNVFDKTVNEAFFI